MGIEKKIVEWYNKNKRDLPWRNTKNPYKIWISEIILQQTRVEQGLNYYRRFLNNFPDVYALAIATEEEVLKCWQGLGYYSRARNLHYSAKYIVNELNGDFPKSYNELKKLKGVGDYTAAAIASFAYNERVPLLDGNVFRLLSRIFAEPAPIDSAKGKKTFFNFAEKMIQSQEPEIFNQAIMEFGALQCKPKNPNCTECVLTKDCIAFKMNEVSKYPVKSKALNIKNRYFNYFFIENKGFTFLKKRDKKDIWKGLYELPLIETKSSISLKKLIQTDEWKNWFGSQNVIIKSTDTTKHQLSHQLLNVSFYHLTINWIIKESESINELKKLPLDEIDKYPVPKLIENYLKKLL